MTKDLTTTQAGALVITNPTIDLAPLTITPDEIAEIMEANFEGMDIKFTKIKMPSGGGLSFKVPSAAGDPEVATELVGVIIDHYPI